MGRAPCCEKVGLKKGRWTPEEDNILTKYIQANGEGSWRSLPKNAGLLRCGKSCRLRWINYLRADLKRGNISVEEENTIVKLHAAFGHRWSLIASHLPGRTDNEIKNYWNSHLSRKIYTFRGTTTKEIITLPPKRKRGRTSRWAMKKNKTYAPQKQHINKEAPLPLPTPPPLETEKHLSTNVMEEPVDGATHHRETTTQEQNLDTMCVESEKEIIINDDLWGPYDGDFINDGEVLNFDDITDSCCLQEASEVWTISREQKYQTNDFVVGNEKGDDASTDIMMSSGELDSSSSMASPLDQNLLTWLWHDEDWEKDFQSFGEIDSEKQNAMADWFLSSS